MDGVKSPSMRVKPHLRAAVDDCALGFVPFPNIVCSIGEMVWLSCEVINGITGIRDACIDGG